VDADLDTLAIALYVRADDLLKSFPERVPWRPRVGIAPLICDAEMVMLSVMQALLGHTSEARWLRFAGEHLRHRFPYLPKQPGYNKRLRQLAVTLNWLIGALARDTSVWSDDVWVVDSTPVECSRSRETVRRSDMAGWAEYGYCASHSRFFWGLRLHLVATLHGLPIGYVLTGAKADERQVLLDLLHDDPTPAASRPGQILLADKNYYGRDFEASIAGAGIRLLRRARKGEPERPRRPVLQTNAPNGRVDLRHPQRPARSRTARRIHPTRSARACPTTPAGHDHSDLAQRPHRPTRQTIPTRLRPLNPWGGLII
jgi:hypothetical protein